MVPSFHSLCNSDLLDWYLSPSISAPLPLSDLLMCCQTMTRRGQDDRERINQMGTGLWVRRGDILLHRRPFPKWENNFPFLGQNALSDLVSLDAGEHQRAGQTAQGHFLLFRLLLVSERPSALHLQALLLYHKMTITLHLDTNFILILFCLH